MLLLQLILGLLLLQLQLGRLFLILRILFLLQLDQFFLALRVGQPLLFKFFLFNFEFLLMQLYVLGLLLFALLIHHFLFKGQFSFTSRSLSLFGFVLGFQFTNHGIFFVNFLSHFEIFFAFSQSYVILERLNALQSRVQQSLLDQNFLAKYYLRLCLGYLSRKSIIVLDAEAGEHAVDANREQLAIVEVESDSFDLKGVCLHLYTL